MEAVRKKIFQVVGLDAVAFNSLRVTNMSAEEFGVFTILSFHGPLSGKEISDIFSRDPEGKVYCILDSLERRGFVTGGENE